MSDTIKKLVLDALDKAIALRSTGDIEPTWGEYMAIDHRPRGWTVCYCVLGAMAAINRYGKAAADAHAMQNSQTIAHLVSDLLLPGPLAVLLVYFNDNRRYEWPVIRDWLAALPAEYYSRDHYKDFDAPWRGLRTADGIAWPNFDPSTQSIQMQVRP